MADNELANHPVKECRNPTDLTSGDLIGLTLTAETGLLSAAAIIAVILLLIRQLVRNLKGSSLSKPIVNTHLDIYMLSLITSDALQAVGAVMDLRWIRQGSVSCGDFCNAQGAIQTLGETSVAMATVVIAIHTFCVIFFRWTPPQNFLIPFIVVGCIWAYVSIYTGVMFGKYGDAFIVPTPYWCWISSRFPNERISQEYFWLWFAAIFSIVLYIPLFFLIRGNIEVDPSRRFYHVSFHRLRGNKQRAGSSFNPSRQSLKMLLYPACYILIILPMTVARWIGFSNPNNKIAPFWTFFAVCIFGLSGIINVLLLTLTRPSILSFGGHGSHGTLPGGGGGGGGGRTTGGGTASFRFAHGTTRAGDNLEQLSRQANTALSVAVHVEHDMVYDDSVSFAEDSSPYSPRKTASNLVTSLRPPTPAYALQDLRDRESHDKDHKFSPSS